MEDPAETTPSPGPRPAAERGVPGAAHSEAKSCQLQTLEGAATPLSARDRWSLRLHKRVRWVFRAAKKAMNDPATLPTRLVTAVRRETPPGAAAESASMRGKWPGLGLQAGDRVRIKSLEDIEAMLDQDGRCDGLAFLPSVMTSFCGGAYTVRKRIDLFFDERSWRMLKVRNVVVLDQVHCVPPREGSEDWAGCDRTCYLFWKEAWLEKLPPDDRG